MPPDVEYVDMAGQTSEKHDVLGHLNKADAERMWRGAA